MMRYLTRTTLAVCVAATLWAGAWLTTPVASDASVFAQSVFRQALGIASAKADNDDWSDLHREVEDGKLVALPTLLDWLDERYIGQVMEVELERDDGEVIYEIEMIGPQGQVVEFEFDAVSGDLIGIDGVGISDMERPRADDQ